MSIFRIHPGVPFNKLFACLAALAVIALLVPATVAQTPTTDATPVAQAGQLGPVPGDTVTIRKAEESARIEATVTDLADPFPSVAATQRGHRVLGIQVAFANLGPDSFTVDPLQIGMLDDAGLYIVDTRYQHYLNEPVTSLLERTTLKPGESTSGWMIFELVSDAEPGGLIYLDYDASDPRVWMLARFGATDFNAAAPTTILNRSAKAIGTIQIEQIITQFERTDPSIAPVRGSRAVSLVLSVENTGDSVWSVEDSLYLIDQFGTFHARYYYDRSTTSRSAYPELKVRVRPGQTQHGVVTFEVPVDSAIAMVVLIPNQEQFFVLGGAYDVITVTPDKYAGSPEDKDWGTDVPGCEEIKAWAEGSWAAMKTASETVQGVKDELETATPDSIRAAAATLRYTAQFQEGVVAPAKAEQAQLDLIALLRAGADALDDAATRIENGESPEAVAKMIDAPKSPFTKAANATITSVLTVMIACPIE